MASNKCSYNGIELRYKCGCGETHTVDLVTSDRFKWNGSFESPTITPQVLRERSILLPVLVIHRCRHAVTAGVIAYASDCTNLLLAGKSQPMPDW